MCDSLEKLSREMMDLPDRKRGLIGMLMTDSVYGKGCGGVLMRERAKGGDRNM